MFSASSTSMDIPVQTFQSLSSSIDPKFGSPPSASILSGDSTNSDSSGGEDPLPQSSNQPSVPDVEALRIRSSSTDCSPSSSSLRSGAPPPLASSLPTHPPRHPSHPSFTSSTSYSTSTTPTPQSSPQSPSLQSVVSKAKLAARSLFNILHAQTCSNNETCAVRGCHEMKLVLLHVKQCSAGPNFPCPHPGCNQARKLLSHYKRCRELRLRQTPDRPHQCLVCSLLAREVKTYERERHNKPRPTTSSNQNNSRPPTYGAVNVTVNVKDKNGRDVHNNSPIQSQYPSCTPRDMPPPPPRVPRTSQNNRTPPNLLYGSPPNIPISMHRNIQTVAALTNPHTDSTSKGLGKSLDSSSGGAWMSGDTGRGSKRDRSVSAGSLDDCKSPAHGRKRNEEPIEAENLPQHNTSKTVNNNNNSNMPMQPQVLVRRRSSSCGVITGIGGFETIREEDDEEEDELGNFQFEY